MNVAFKAVAYYLAGGVDMPVNNEREELHRAIWAIADDLRGSVDGWDFKQYILGVCSIAIFQNT